jgi:hypothetical protein
MRALLAIDSLGSVMPHGPQHSPADTELPDEDTLVIPAGWRRILHPRRGGVPGPAIRVDPGAVRRLADEMGDEIVARMRSLLPDMPALDRVGIDQMLDGLRVGGAGAASTPADAAASAAIYSRELTVGSGWNRAGELAAFTDEWVAKHGIVFAARAVAEYHDLFIGFAGSPPRLYVRRRSDDDYVSEEEEPSAIAARLRAHLARATDDEYHAAVAALAEYRHDLGRLLLTAFLVPDRADWVAEACAALPAGPPPILLCALGSIDALTRLPPPTSLYWALRGTSTLPTLVDGVGPAIAPTLAGWFDTAQLGADIRKRLLEALAMLPTDEAFDLLVARLDQQYVRQALTEAAKRYPVRAVRLLAKASAGSSTVAAIAADLLRTHVLANRDLIAAARAALPADVTGQVDKIESTMPRVDALAPDALPTVLVAPPWTQKRAAVEPVVIDGLVRNEPGVQLSWAPGERESWAATQGWTPVGTNSNWDKAATDYDAGRLPEHHEPAFFGQAPEHLARPRLAGWKPTLMWYVEPWLRSLAARYQADAVPLLVHVAALSPATAAGPLLPFGSTEVAVLMADWLARLKSVRPAALAWFHRHPGPAVRGLVPGALSKPGRERKAAEAALRLVASATCAADVTAVAREYGDTVAAAIETLLATDPLDLLPARMPAIPEWAHPALLPPIRHRDGLALPAAAVGHVVTMLAISRPGEVYAGLDVVREICDPASLAEFGWALFQNWQSAGLPAKETWALHALGWIGDDETVRRLTPLIRSWPGEGGHARAVTALDALVAVGSDVALMHLHGIAQKVKFKGLKTKAQEKITEVAAALELTPDQLADRLVPDLGLDEDGSLTLDYGPRRFVVGFDEALRPSVTDEDGKRRKDLPKPGARDDQDLAAAAYKRFAALKRDARTLVADQVTRLERAMVWQRRWTATEFHDLLVRHALLWHLVRRLVWASYDDDGVAATFRVAEDRTLAGPDDDTVELPGSARVGIAHPLHLGGLLDTWSALFADYEILQPFPQLGRTVHILTDDERGDTSLRRFEKVSVQTGRILGLTRRGWQRATPQDAGVEPWIARPLPGGRAIVINLDPGIAAGYTDMTPDHEIEHVWLSATGDGDWRPAAGLRFGELDAVTASEVLADLTELTS